MEEKQLPIDRNCHAVYSEPCKEIVLSKIKEHYKQEEVEAIFEKVQLQYVDYLKDYCRKDLGGEKNFHNKKSGTYDCIMLVSYYVACKEKSSFSEIEEMCKELIIGNFEKLGFVNINKPLYKRLMYLAFKSAEKKCKKWKDYEMHVDPYSKEKPLHYRFTSCPFADFIRQYGLEEIGGALCNVDFFSMEAMNVKLVRKHTCIEGKECDYTFYAKDDPRLKEHPEYIDERGFIRNK